MSKFQQKADSLTPKSNSIQIHTAKTKDEKEKIYQLRYQVFVSEIEKRIPGIDHEKKQITDALDKDSILLFAEDNSKIIGTMRVSLRLAENYPKDLFRIFKMNNFKTILQNYPIQLLGLSTKFAITPEYRGTSTMYQLVAESFRIFQNYNVQFAFGGGNPHLISLYERVGYRRFTTNFTDPGYGLLIPIVLLVNDHEHLQKVHSPFFRFVRNRADLNDPIIGEQFRRAFPNVNEYFNTQLTNKEDLTRYIKSKFPKTPLLKLSIFQHLSETDILAFLQLGTIFSCTEGDCIISSGETGNELYFLLSGAAVWETEHAVSLLHPGQCFGSSDFTNPVIHSATVTVLVETEIVVITRQDFEKFTRQHPEAATLISQNLKTIVELSPNTSPCRTVTEEERA